MYVLTSQALLSIKCYYSKRMAPAKKELNFELVDKSVYEAGLRYCSLVLDRYHNIGKLDLDEMLDKVLNEISNS